MKKVADIMQGIMTAENVSQREMARRLGVTQGAVNAKIRNNSMSAEAFFQWADLLGYDVILQRREGGGVFSARRKASGPRVSRVIDKVRYDTDKAEMICRTTEENGFYLELFKGDEGGFFLVHYNVGWENADHLMTVATYKDALAFYRLHGDGSADEFFDQEGEQ